MIPVDIWNPVMPRQPFVQVRIVGSQEIQHAPVFAELIGHKLLGLLTHGPAQILVKIGKRIGVRYETRQLAQLQPLIDEIGHQRSRTRVGQHAPYLPLEHRGLPEFPGDSCIQKLIVGNAAPHKE